jgi:Ca2+-binding EF-hand superfamily protein
MTMNTHLSFGGTMKKLLLSLSLAVVAGCSGEPAPIETPPDPPAVPVTGWKLTPQPSDPLPQVLKHYDANGNGILEESERRMMRGQQERLRQLRQQYALARYDTNSNGQLDAAEQDTARQQKESANQAGHHAALARYDRSGDGTLDAAERETMRADREAFLARARQQVLRTHDRNGNGVLDPDEHARLWATVRQQQPRQ